MHPPKIIPISFHSRFCRMPIIINRNSIISEFPDKWTNNSCRKLSSSHRSRRRRSNCLRMSWSNGSHSSRKRRPDWIWAKNQSSWGSNGMDQICAHMRAWDIQCLWLGDNKEPTILKNLQHVSLNHLIRIDVSGNLIQSIESLFRMTLPSLKELYLQQNVICSLNPIQRCQLPALYFIGLGNNCIQDASCLSRMQLSGLTWLGCEHTDCQLFSNDVRWVVKLDTNKLSMLQLENGARIIEQRLDKVLLRRFTNLEQVNRR